MDISCKEKILTLMADTKERTAYEISKEVSFSYGTVHRYIRELLFEGKVKVKRRTDKVPMKIYYVISEKSA